MQASTLVCITNSTYNKRSFPLLCVPLDYCFGHHPGAFLPAGGKYRYHDQMEAVLQVSV